MNRYFKTYTEAIAFIRNKDLKCYPIKTEVWGEDGCEEVWMVEV